MRVRALTLLIDYFEYHNEFEKLINKFLLYSKNSNIEIWTKRIAINPININDLLDMSNKIVNSLNENIDYVAIPVELKNNKNIISIILKILKINKKIFLSFFGDEENFEIFIKIVYNVSNKLSPFDCTRICFTFNGPLLTPYFPSASAKNGEIGIAAALFYVNDLMECLKNKSDLYKKISKIDNIANEFLSNLSSNLIVKNYGVDLSLSPWMEESVALLLEKICKKKFNSPGIRYAIFYLNKLIREISSKNNHCGFNEVMLPYAEDSRLMELGKKGLISTYDLLSLSSICVAGLDMVLFSIDNFDNFFNFMKDCYAFLYSKNKPSGIRVIPIKCNPGKIIKIKKFGKIPVLKLK
ncbi:MAG: DUF711 family protein [Nitrososphaerota archaeon]